MKVPKPRKLPSGSWFIRVTVDGKVYSITRPTKAEAQAAAMEIKLSDKKPAADVTVAEAIERYISERENILSPSTIRGYRIIQRNRFQSVQHLKISAVKNWQKVVNEEAKICAPKTLKNSWLFLVSVLKQNGVEAGKIALPAIPKSTHPFLDYEQIKVFMSVIEDTEIEVPCLLALHGFRCSEMLPMTTANKVGNLLVMSGTMVPDQNNNFVFKETAKNETSSRSVPIMIPRLAKLIEAKDGPLVTMHPNALRKAINRTCEKNGLPEVGIHGLRHSFASLCYHLGLSEMQTMELGGWKDASTMRKIYTHLAQQDKNRSVEKLTEFFSTPKM